MARGILLLDNPLLFLRNAIYFSLYMLVLFFCFYRFALLFLSWCHCDVFNYFRKYTKAKKCIARAMAKYCKKTERVQQILKTYQNTFNPYCSGSVDAQKKPGLDMNYKICCFLLRCATRSLWETFCCVLGQDVLLSQRCLSPPRSINGTGELLK